MALLEVVMLTPPVPATTSMAATPSAALMFTVPAVVTVTEPDPVVWARMPRNRPLVLPMVVMLMLPPFVSA